MIAAVCCESGRFIREWIPALFDYAISPTFDGKDAQLAGRLLIIWMFDRLGLFYLACTRTAVVRERRPQPNWRVCTPKDVSSFGGGPP